MDIAFIAFTEKGLGLARRLSQGLEQRGHNTSVTCGFGPNKENHDEWERRQFSSADALVFIGATGIAVRSIAPLLKGKGVDPAVVVLDAAKTAFPCFQGIWAARTSSRMF